MKQIDLVLPCYNPPDSWVDNIKHSFEVIARAFPNYIVCLWVVNDGSPNIAAAEVARLNAQLPAIRWLEYTENRGKGFALRHGVAATDGDFVLFTDIDFPYENDSTIAVLTALCTETVDIAVGVRADTYYEKVPMARRIISRTLRALIGVLFNMPITDTQCGLKGFNRAGRAVFLSTTIERYLFDLEFIFLASQQKHLRLKPIEVQLKPNIIFTSMNYKVLLTEGKNFLKVLLNTFFKSNN